MRSNALASALADSDESPRDGTRLAERLAHGIAPPEELLSRRGDSSVALRVSRLLAESLGFTVSAFARESVRLPETPPTEFLAKPFRRADLEATLLRALRGAE